MSQPTGLCLDSIFTTLSSFEQNAIVAQIAQYMLEVFRHHRFDKIGALKSSEDAAVEVGSVALPSFYIDGRSSLTLDRGPFDSARAYYLACAQRELDCSRVLFVQDASPAYQRDLEDARLQIERIVGLLHDLIVRCQGLDGDDPVFAPFSLDIHQLSLKSIFVSPDDSSKIVCLLPACCRV